MSKQVCVLGAGAWGTAVATVLAHNGHTVKLWSYEPDVAQSINNAHENTCYLPGIQLPALITATTSIQEALAGATLIFEATPVQFLRSVLEPCKPFYSPTQTWVVLSKGVELGAFLFPADIVREVFGQDVRVAIVGGPGFAKNLANKELTAAMVASRDESCAQEVALALACDYYHLYVSVDEVGVQLCGVIKNVLSLGMGMFEGAGYGDNVRALFLTAGYQELLKCGFALGAEIDTLYGLPGFGDLVLSSMGASGKNLALGKRLGAESNILLQPSGAGALPEDVSAIAHKGIGDESTAPFKATGGVSAIVLTTAEGMNACGSMPALAKKAGFELPVLCGIQAVAEGSLDVSGLLKRLIIG